MINSILSLIAFKNQKTRELGCGISLLCPSILTSFNDYIHIKILDCYLFTNWKNTEWILFKNSMSFDFV